jgi:metallophosphoesterase (TIGR00282 family)
LRILFLGDIIGRPGRRTVAALLPDLQEEHRIDFTVANAENAAAGLGLTEKIAHELLDLGIDVLTSGNHIWKQKEALTFLPRLPQVLRPANYPPAAPGCGWGVFSAHNGEDLAVINLQGRVFMEPMDCPFRGADALLAELPTVSAILVDFHAEATSEKAALGRYLDGRVTAVVGTHTHVQTADQTILPGGTAFISDVGMTGPSDSVIGIVPETSLQRFLTGIPAKFEVPKRGPCILSAVVIESAAQKYTARSIQRILEPLDSE